MADTSKNDSSKILGTGAVSRRTALKAGAAAAVGVALGTPAFWMKSAYAAGAVTLRFGSDSPIGAPHSKSATVLKEMLEKETSGRIQVSIFPDGQLGGNTSMTNSVKAGTLDGVMTDVAHMSSAVPEADVFNLPFLFKDPQHLLRGANGALGDAVKPKLEEAFGCRALGWATDGSRNLWNNKHAIHKPADVAGLKMRVQPSKIQRDTILALSGTPTPISLNDMYTGLQTGLIDGGDQAVNDMVQLKLYQVSKYLTVTHHYCILSVLILSKKFFDVLTPEDQALITSVAKQAADAHVKETLDSEGASLDMLKSKGIQIIEPDNIQDFVDKVQSVHKDAEARIGSEIVSLAKSVQ